MTELEWKRTAADIPTYELNADSSFYVEQWGLGSWAAYHGDVAIGEPGIYGTRAEAKAAAELEYRHYGPLQHARFVLASYRRLAAAEPESTGLAELVRRSEVALADAELREHMAAEHKGIALANTKHPVGRPAEDITWAHDTAHGKFAAHQSHTHDLVPVPA
jgi:hypothetical protein